MKKKIISVVIPTYNEELYPKGFFSQTSLNYCG